MRIFDMKKMFSVMVLWVMSFGMREMHCMQDEKTYTLQCNALWEEEFDSHERPVIWKGEQVLKLVSDDQDDWIKNVPASVLEESAVLKVAVQYASDGENNIRVPFPKDIMQQLLGYMEYAVNEKGKGIRKIDIVDNLVERIEKDLRKFSLNASLSLALISRLSTLINAALYLDCGFIYRTLCYFMVIIKIASENGKVVLDGVSDEVMKYIPEVCKEDIKIADCIIYTQNKQKNESEEYRKNIRIEDLVAWYQLPDDFDTNDVAGTVQKFVSQKRWDEILNSVTKLNIYFPEQREHLIKVLVELFGPHNAGDALALSRLIVQQSASFDVCCHIVNLFNQLKPKSTLVGALLFAGAEKFQQNIAEDFNAVFFINNIVEIINAIPTTVTTSLFSQYLDLVLPFLPYLVAEKIRALDLSQYELTKVPEEIGLLRDLMVLNLGSNEISSLPKQIADLKQLQGLDLSKNDLTHVPDVIRELKNLEAINLSRNRIAALPEWVAQMENEKLEIVVDDIVHVPDVLQNHERITIQTV